MNAEEIRQTSQYKAAEQLAIDATYMPVLVIWKGRNGRTYSDNMSCIDLPGEVMKRMMAGQRITRVKQIFF